MANASDLLDWVRRDICRFGRAELHVLVLEQTEKTVHIRIFTDRTQYGIRASSESERGYLGCVAQARKPRAGEDWHRGNDLDDGPLNEETWHKILGDIVSYEMVRLHGPASQRPVPDIVINVTGAGGEIGAACGQANVEKPES